PCPQGANDGIAIRARFHDGCDGHTHALGVKPEGEPDNHAFQPPHAGRPWIGDVEDVQSGPAGASSGSPRKPWCRSQLALNATPREAGNCERQPSSALALSTGRKTLRVNRRYSAGAGVRRMTPS